MRVNLLKPKVCLGVAAGFVASVISSTSLVSKALPEEASQETLETNVTSTVRNADDRSIEDIISSLRGLNRLRDSREEETLSVDITWPTARKAALDLYRAEAEDVKALREGKITEKDRKVRICFTDFIPPYEDGEDGGVGPSINVVKNYGETYVIESWPINKETGDVLLPDSIRVSTQILNENNRFSFVTNMFQVVWGVNYGGTSNGEWELPFFYRQYLFGEFNSETKRNPTVQKRLFLSNSHNSCISCHCHIQSMNLDDTRFFGKKTNFVSVTKPEDFNRPYAAQVGFLKLMAWLQDKVEHDKLTQKQVSTIAEELLDSTNIRVPSIIEALEDHETIPWIGEDTLVKEGEVIPEGFTYKERENDKKVWEKAAYEYFKANGALTGVGEWWNVNDLKAIP